MTSIDLNRLKKGLANPAPLAEAQETWKDVREANGLSRLTPPLLTPPTGNAKLAKTQQWGLSLIPHRLGDVGNVCKYSTKGCRYVCLNTAGRGAMSKVQVARKARTQLLVQHPEAFATLFGKEFNELPYNAALRLNVFSDLPWETIWPELFTWHSDIVFYDYTKWPVGSRTVPANYHLTYSASELWTDVDIIRTVKGGDNVTVVLDVEKKDALPTTWHELTVVNGDESDARFLDPKGVVVALRAKGKARSTNSKFVRKVPQNV